MENFDWTQFTRKIAINSSIQTIYNAWTIPLELEKWFLSDALFYDDKGNKISKSKAANKGNTYNWRWYLYPITESGNITIANGKDHFQFTFAGECIVDVKISSIEETTLVTITQKNIPTDDESKKNIRLGCDQGWSFYLVNLKSIYEGGIDLRNKNEKLKPMINN
jgi:hypothetical protein